MGVELRVSKALYVVPGSIYRRFSCSTRRSSIGYDSPSVIAPVGDANELRRYDLSGAASRGSLYSRNPPKKCM